MGSDEQSVELVKNEFEEINQKLTVLVQEIEQAEEFKNNLSRDIENLVAKKNEHQRFISEAHQELEQIRNSLEEGSRITENFINKANHLREEIEALERQKEIKASEIFALKQNFNPDSLDENSNPSNPKSLEIKNNLQQEINQLKKQHEHLELLNQQLNHEKMIHESKIDELDHMFKMKQAEVVGFEDRLKDLQKEIVKFNNIKGDVIKSLEVAKKDKWLIQTATDELKCNIETLNQTKAEMERHINEKKDQVEEFENRYHHFSDEFEKLHKNYIDLRNNTQNLSKTKLEAAKKLGEINQNLVNKKNQLNHVNDRFKSKEAGLQKNINQKRTELVNLKSDLGQLKKNYQSKTAEFNQVEKQIIKSKITCERLDINQKKLIDQIKQAKSTVDTLALKEKDEIDRLVKMNKTNELHDGERLKLLVKKSKIDAQIDEANKALQKVETEETQTTQRILKLKEQSLELEQTVAIFEKEFEVKAQKVQELNSRIKYQSDVLKRQISAYKNIWQDVWELYQAEKSQYDILVNEKNRFLKDYEKNLFSLENRVAVLKVKETVAHQSIDEIQASIQNEKKRYDEQLQLNKQLEKQTLWIQSKVDGADDELKAKIAEAGMIIGQYQKEHQALHDKSEELDLKRWKTIVSVSRMEQQARNKINSLEKLNVAHGELFEQINRLSLEKEKLGLKKDLLEMERLKMIVATSKTQHSYDVLKTKIDHEKNVYEVLNTKLMGLAKTTEELELKKLKLIVQNSKVEHSNECNLLISKKINQEIQELQHKLDGKKIEYQDLQNQYDKLDTKRMSWLVVNSKLENNCQEMIRKADKIQSELDDKIQNQESQIKKQQLEMAKLEELKMKSKEELNIQGVLIEDAVAEKIRMIFEEKKQEQIIDSLKEKSQKESMQIQQKQKEFELHSLKNQELINQIVKKQAELKEEGIKYDEQVVFMTKKIDELSQMLAALNNRIEKAKSIDEDSREVAKKALTCKSTLLAEIQDLEVKKKTLLEKNDVPIAKKKYDFKKAA